MWFDQKILIISWLENYLFFAFVVSNTLPCNLITTILFNFENFISRKIVYWHMFYLNQFCWSHLIHLIARNWAAAMNLWLQYIELVWLVHVYFLSEGLVFKEWLWWYMLVFYAFYHGKNFWSGNKSYILWFWVVGFQLIQHINCKSEVSYLPTYLSLTNVFDIVTMWINLVILWNYWSISFYIYLSLWLRARMYI